MGDRKISCASNGSSVKIAGLWKRSQGLRKFTKPNWRHRVFILTEQVFSYYSGTLDVRYIATLDSCQCGIFSF
jgi:hypothetical protein